MKEKIRIIPSLIAKNQAELEERFSKVKFSKWLHIDVMDGKFVKNKSNWFNFKLPKTHKYEIHLMVEKPLKWVKKNYQKGDIIIGNIEKLNPEKFIDFLKNKEKKKAFALNPETPFKKVFPYLNQIDQILILCVHPGKYGGEFLPSAIKKIRELRKSFKGKIEADGGQNPKTIPKTVKAGANVVVVGSYLQNSSNAKSSMLYLSKILD